jgi:hypothetical protein
MGTSCAIARGARRSLRNLQPAPYWRRLDVIPVPQHECLIAVIDEFLLELSQRGLRARIETFHDVAGFVFD